MSCTQKTFGPHSGEGTNDLTIYTEVVEVVEGGWCPKVSQTMTEMTPLFYPGLGP